MPKPLPNTYYIAFADDITHLTSDAARNTTNAIQHINAYENKWKIKTNKNKFLIIPISRLNTADIFINNDSLRYTAEGKFRGLSFHSRGISPQITNRYTAEGKFRGLSFHSRGISPQITNRKALALQFGGLSCHSRGISPQITNRKALALPI